MTIFNFCKGTAYCNMNDWYIAVSYAIRDRMMAQWIKALNAFTEDITVVAHLSGVFLGLSSAAVSLTLGMYDDVYQAVKG
jgi:hypothetical protein